MRISLGLLAALATTMALLGLNAGQALANHVHCGDVITQDTTLDSDLACAGDGIVIGAGNVTLDLGGHRISGSMAPSSAGVRVRGPYDEYLPDISITNGTVTGFQFGVSMEWSDAAISDLRLVRNWTGLYTEWMRNLSIVDTLAADNLDRGIDADRATEHGPSIHNVVATRNGGQGIAVVSGDEGFTLEDSAATDNGDAGVFLYKIFSATGSVARNRITGNARDGLRQQYCAVDAIGNVIAHNGGDGIAQSYTGCEIRDNTIFENKGNGIQQGFGSLNANGNRIRQNGLNGVLISGNLGDPLQPGADLKRNLISQNALDGVHIDLIDTRHVPPTRTTLLQQNAVDRNGDDGIDTANPYATLVGNHTWWNGDLGIAALPGTSGSGNWAKHNGNPAQCIPGYLCSTKGKPKG